jgi:hypothetical protein
MKKLIVFVMISCFMISNIARADCDWSFIKNMPNGDYEYTPECHLKVGQLVQDNATQLVQIQDLNAAIALKNLALTASDQRVALWQKTADDSQDRLSKIDSDSKRNDWIAFSLGALTMLGAGYMASRLLHP